MLPGWSAATVIVPTPVTVSMFPLTVPGPERTLNVTGKPEDAVAVRVMGVVV